MSAGISDANLNVIQNYQVQKIEAEANALEKKVVKLERLVQILDERAGPARVDSDSSESDFKSISPVSHEAEQRDQTFAKMFTFTTNVIHSP